MAYPIVTAPHPRYTLNLDSQNAKTRCANLTNLAKFANHLRANPFCNRNRRKPFLSFLKTDNCELISMNPTSRTFILRAAVFAFLGVALGAFGAHALNTTLTANGRENTFDTAVHYQLVHAVALLAAAWIADKNPKRLTRAGGYLFAAGIILFSGSLYILAIFNLGLMGAVAPLGGASFLAGWFCLGLSVWRDNKTL